MKLKLFFVIGSNRLTIWLLVMIEPLLSSLLFYSMILIWLVVIFIRINSLR